MNCTPPEIHSVTFIRGNRWTLTARLRVKGDPSFSWLGSVAEFRLKASRAVTAPVLLAISPVVSMSPGVLIAVADIPGTTSATLPDSFAADLVVSRDSPAFGPYSPVQIDFALTPAA